MQLVTEVDINQIKLAQTDYPIHPLLGERWSPRAFAKRPIAAAIVCQLFEAARWSASGGNGQPWSFVIASQAQPDAFARLRDCLEPANAEWAQEAALLGIAIAQTIRSNGKPNRLAFYDLGLAMQNLCIQATALDLYVHQMGGFSADKARDVFHIPETHEAAAAFAIGYLGDPNTLNEKNREREFATRTRNPIQEFVFTEQWGAISELVK